MLLVIWRTWGFRERHVMLASHGLVAVVETLLLGASCSGRVPRSVTPPKHLTTLKCKSRQHVHCLWADRIAGCFDHRPPLGPGLGYKGTFFFCQFRVSIMYILHHCQYLPSVAFLCENNRMCQIVVKAMVGNPSSARYWLRIRRLQEAKGY